MNLVDCVVTKVLSGPYEYKDEGWEDIVDTWFVDVEYNSYGAISKTTLMFASREKAESITEGYKFTA